MRRDFIYFFFLFYPFCLHAQKWLPVGSGVSGDGEVVYCFEVFDSVLYTGGWFAYAGGDSALSIARWDGADWDSVGSGVCCAAMGWPKAMEVHNGELYAAGFIPQMGGVSGTYNIARWNGSSWQAAGASGNDNSNNLYALASYNNELYAGGNITKLGGININRIARWDGNTWKDVGGGVTGGVIPSVYCMAVYKNELYVGGDFTYAGGMPANFIAKWDGTKWDSVGGGLDDLAVTMVVDTNLDVLYVGGGFTTAGDSTVKYIAKWNGSNWSSVGNPIACCQDMEIFKDQLYVAGSSSTGSSSDTIIARWDGSNWHHVKGPNNTVATLEVYKDELYIGGYFDKIDTGAGIIAAITVNHIARLTMSQSLDTSTKDSIEKSIKIFPNPTKDSFFLEIQNISLSNTEAKIFDVTGKLVYHSPINSITTEISCGNWAKGIYFIKIFSDRIVIANEKIVIE